jgi:hypothetical protein
MATIPDSGPLNAEQVLEASNAIPFDDTLRGPARTEAFFERRRQDAALEARFAEHLANEHAPFAPENVQADIYTLAAEQSNGGGYNQIESNYIDLAVLVHTTIETVTA